MPIVNEKELVEKAKQKQKELDATVKEEMIGDTKVYIGANGVKYTQRGEALDSLQVAKEQDEFKKQGLNEHGQTPEQVAAAKRRAELFKKREEKLKEVADIDAEITGKKTEKKKEDKKK